MEKATGRVKVWPTVLKTVLPSNLDLQEKKNNVLYLFIPKLILGAHMSAEYPLIKRFHPI